MFDRIKFEDRDKILAKKLADAYIKEQNKVNTIILNSNEE